MGRGEYILLSYKHTHVPRYKQMCILYNTYTRYLSHVPGTKLSVVAVAALAFPTLTLPWFQARS